MRTDQSLWCWGYNGFGQLGLGDAGVAVLVPTRVGTDQDWAGIAPGGYHTCAGRTDRSLWCWGRNADGALGLSDTTDRDIPTQVGIDQDWAKIATGVLHSCAVRTDRSLWCWGLNAFGQLGLGGGGNRLVPTRV